MPNQPTLEKAASISAAAECLLLDLAELKAAAATLLAIVSQEAANSKCSNNNATNEG